MKTNKIYKDALALTMTAGTSSTMQNKWLKIEISTEDQKLKYFAETLRRLFSLMLKSNSHSYNKPINFEGIEIYSNHQTVPLLRQKNTLAKEYLESVLATEQPQWQVIALQHGWTPPVKQQSLGTQTFRT